MKRRSIPCFSLGQSQQHQRQAAGLLTVSRVLRASPSALIPRLARQASSSLPGSGWTSLSAVQPWSFCSQHLVSLPMKKLMLNHCGPSLVVAVAQVRTPLNEAPGSGVVCCGSGRARVGGRWAGDLRERWQVRMHGNLCQ